MTQSEAQAKTADLLDRASELLDEAYERGYADGVTAAQARIAELLSVAAPVAGAVVAPVAAPVVAPVAAPVAAPEPARRGRPPAAKIAAASSAAKELTVRVLSGESGLLPAEILEAAASDTEKALTAAQITAELNRGLAAKEYVQEEDKTWSLNI